MTDLLTALAQTLHARPSLALLGAFLWGVAGVLLSPCHLASVPLIIAYTGRTATLSARRAGGLSVVFALGILVTVVVMGLFSVVTGRMLVALGSATNYIIAALLFVVGLDLLGAWPFQWSGVPRAQTTRRGVGGAFLFGLAFGTALGPCTFAFLGPVIALAMHTAGAQPFVAGLFVLAYGIGHCGILALVGASGPAVSRYVGRTGAVVGVLRRACGVLVLAGGLYLVYSA